MNRTAPSYPDAPLGIVALVLLFRRSGRTPTVAIIATVLYLPAFLAEQTGNFSSLRPPTAIEGLEIVQTVLVVIVLGVSFWLLRRGADKKEGTGGT